MEIKEIAVNGVSFSDDKIVLDCRVLEGTIKVGDSFNMIREQRDYDNASEIPFEQIPKHPLKTTIISIKSYGHNFDELESGMTCLIKVQADKKSLIKEGHVLYMGSKENQ